MDDMQSRLKVLRARHGSNGLLGLLVDVLYERGSLGEVLDDVEEADRQLRRLDTRAAPIRSTPCPTE